MLNRQIRESGGTIFHRMPKLSSNSITIGNSSLFRRRINFAIILVLLINFSLLASDDVVIKLDKNITYTGTTLDKKPFGMGKLNLYLGKNDSPLEIKGTFKDNKILYGSYSNRISSKTGFSGNGQRKTIFTFDSLEYLVDKKKHVFLIRAFGIKPDNKSKISDNLSLEFKYVYGKDGKSKMKGWSVLQIPPHDFTVTVYDTDQSMGKYTFEYRSAFKKGEREVRRYENGSDFTYLLIGSLARQERSYFFEPIDLPTYTIENIDNIKQPIIIKYDNGASVRHDGKTFTSMWGNSSATGEYHRESYLEGQLASLTLNLNNDNIASSNLSYSGEWKGEISFSNGTKYIGNLYHESLSPDKFGLNLLNPNFVINESFFKFGKFFTSDNYLVKYEHGKPDQEDILSTKLKAYKVKSPGYADAPFITHRLANNDVVEDSRPTLRDFSASGTEKYRGYNKEDLNILFSDEYYYKEPVKFKYDESVGALTFKGHAQEIYSNSDPKDFYVEIDDHLCLSYPKSRVSLHHGKNYFGQPRSVPTMEIVGLPIDTYKRIEDCDCELVWVFKIEKFGNHELFGNTTRLYIIERSSQNILANISESLDSDNTTYKKETQEVYKEKKKVYHERGRVENCGVCFGTGKGWQGGYCPFCGGKGWYIEHEW